MTRRRLPIGIQTFREVREDGCYYVDKTPFIEQLLDGGKHYFLSRPRRFGKSLFLDTLKELFEGSEALFEGLAIHDRWDWSVRYPVVRDWYNGYNWLGEETVYNPFDMLLLFRKRKLGPYWFETGTPAFLVQTLFERRVSTVSLGETVSTGELLSAFDVEHIGTEALLFQTGYLTIRSEEDLGGKVVYRLDYPNREVRQSLNEHLLRHLVRDSAGQTANGIRLYRLLEANDFEGMKELFHAFYASIPYEWYTNNDTARFEGYYASVFYSYFAALGVDVTVEDSASRGRLDMAVRFNGHVYLFELKVVEQAGPGAALAQLKARGYADKYRALGEPIHLVGVEFSSASRNVTAFDTELAGRGDPESSVPVISG